MQICLSYNVRCAGATASLAPSAATMFAVAAPNVVARPSARKAAAPKRGALVIRMQGKVRVQVPR